MIFDCADDNILLLRERYPSGLHFVVGDVHGEVKTLMDLMAKIRFDPSKDHVYFVGDYNAGGNVHMLLRYISNYYQADMSSPGFHLIRGNHERELLPVYMLKNLPDIFVIRGGRLNFYIAHAGMISPVFDLISDDIEKAPEQKAFAYKLEDHTVTYDAPLRQIIWSRRGLYSQRSRRRVWPSEDRLTERSACIVHGHTPYCFLCGTHYSSYGDRNLFWKNQHVWFSEDLHSFNIDANLKGRYENGESYRGLACLCIEVFDAVAERDGGRLTVDGILSAENGIFAVPYSSCRETVVHGDILKLETAAPEMKTISLNKHGEPCFV